jgi:hypothetical protein
MTNPAKAYAPSDIAIRVAYYSLAVSAFVFVGMLLLSGVRPW